VASPDRGRELIVLFLIGLVAVAARAHRLGDGLWYDEVTTCMDYVRQPLGAALTTFQTQNQHLLYTLTAHVSVALFGDSIEAVRLPAFAFGIGSLAALFGFGRLVLTRAEALGATALASVSYYHVYADALLRPFQRYDNGVVSAYYLPKVDMRRCRALIEDVFPEPILV
jgi:hypothetical protein